jgi:pSer/pThr/pTyr-binding forkhead associated (FHA) protein
MKLSLVVAQGNPPGKEIPIRLSQFLIGRDPDCHLRPASPLVSKRHCAILQRDNQVFVRDFNSTNGTYVNQVQIKGERELKSGDELRLGPLVFNVKITDVPASNETVSDKMAASLADTQSLVASQPPAKAETTATATTPATVKRSGGTSAKMPALQAEAKPAPKPATKSEDDDIAALLFNLEGDETSTATSDQIPQGTTLMEALSPEALAAADAAAAQAEAEEKGPEKKGPSNRAKIQDHKATSEAAKSILDQYMRRSRGR